MYMATVTTESERTRYALTLALPQAVAFLVGPALAARTAAWWGLHNGELAAGVFLLVALVPLLVFVLPDTHSVPRNALSNLRWSSGWTILRVRLRRVLGVHRAQNNSGLREGVLLRMLLIAPFVCYELVGRQFVMRRLLRGPTDVAWLLGVSGAATVAVQMALPRLQRRCTPKQVYHRCLLSEPLRFSNWRSAR